jgi:ubiquinol-cytochrome c reductase iron-sulfur subunit
MSESKFDPYGEDNPANPKKPASTSSGSPSTGKPAQSEYVEDEIVPVEPPQEIDAKAAKRAERQVATMFMVSVVCTFGFIVAYFALPATATVEVPLIGITNASNLSLGLALGLSTLLIGLGAIQWARKLMPHVELVQQRHSLKPPESLRKAALTQFSQGAADSGLGQRRLLRRTLLASLLVFPLPLVVLARGCGPAPKGELNETMWTGGLRFLAGITNQPLKPADVPIGGVVSAIPEGLPEVQKAQHNLNERAKSAVILIRMRPDQIRTQQGEGWDYQGILAFSKICTHVGCPIALYEQRTHHLLCPCHQSTFDLANGGKVIFGPAARRLPQLPITVDAEGYLVAREGFQEPVGPSFWERS